MSTSPKMSMAETICRLCAGGWVVVRRVTDNLSNRVKIGARAAAATTVDWPPYIQRIEADPRVPSSSRSARLMRLHGLCDLDRRGALRSEALDIATVSKSAQADVEAMRRLRANSNS
jgi:hypothetical protein